MTIQINYNIRMSVQQKLEVGGRKSLHGDLKVISSEKKKDYKVHAFPLHV